jgi:hypothetical protein
MEAVVFLALVLFVVPLLFPPSVLHMEDRSLSLALSAILGALLFAAFAQAHQVVWGFADETGICYKRYFGWKHASWGQVESITRRPIWNTIHVNLQGYDLLNRHLMFITDRIVLGAGPSTVSFEDLRGMWVRAQHSQANSS